MRRSLPALSFLLPGAALGAQSAGVEFAGTVLSSCAVLADTPGTLEANGTGDVLSSEGGLPGVALVTATGLGYEVVVDAPTAFDFSPPDGGTGVTFASSFEASGATVVSATLAGTQVSLGLGLTSLTIDTTARRASGVFPAGGYQATAVVRCFVP